MITLDNLQDADGTLEEQKNNISEDNPSQEEVENVEKTPESAQETTEVQGEEVETEKTEEINEEKNFNYEDLSLESLISEFEQLLKNDDLYSIRPKINTLKKVS